ncbi:hypothetical protein MNBD_ALPHA01-1436 [hydrothermal vent metagenome]|uniref:Uncharacterized protein n=1 Tax=hydrothermal vent metagenome TaxID=652676 RepID=A0A3B0SFQ6_9ZZZZ
MLFPHFPHFAFHAVGIWSKGGCFKPAHYIKLYISRKYDKCNFNIVHLCYM